MHEAPARGAATATPSAGYARTYDRLYRLGYHKRTSKSHAKVLSERARERWEPESMLDVGCSHGWALGYFDEHGAEAIGIEVSQVAVRRAQRLGRDARVACASSLPFEDDRFDVVLSTDCLEHLREDDAHDAVREMCRVARRGIAIKVNPRLDRDRWWQLLARGPLHLTLKPVETWLRWFEELGWSVVQADTPREEFLLEPVERAA